ncbi:MAG: DUF302 domain-containing protein [Alphaproteobacteria bacterium]|nr:DUF302 domain-containing protein [Alphaproteobacteria bacterium]MCW5743175.1 DUF302 domain-containing protein [Alphaproteobacteria bacterium]
MAAVASENGIVAVPSQHSVADSVSRIEAAAKARGLTIFARIDHSGEAKKAGLEMRPTQLIVLGNPKGGTPLMQARPSLAIDLPLKILVWQDAAGTVWAGYNDPAMLKQRHGLSEEQAKPLGAVGGLIAVALK